MKIHKKRAIENEADIELMVDSFYQKVNQDPLLSPIFNGFANVDWQIHLPKMYLFWGKMLLGKSGYEGRPFPPHLPLPIDATHFERWVSLFVTNMDELFEGEIAEMAKTRAISIAQIFENKLHFINSYQVT